MKRLVTRFAAALVLALAFAGASGPALAGDRIVKLTLDGRMTASNFGMVTSTW